MNDDRLLLIIHHKHLGRSAGEKAVAEALQLLGLHEPAGGWGSCRIQIGQDAGRRRDLSFEELVSDAMEHGVPLILWEALDSRDP